MTGHFEREASIMLGFPVAIVLVGIIAGVVGTAILTWPDDAVSPEEAFRRGVRLAREGRTQEAQTEFRQALDSFQNAPAADLECLRAQDCDVRCIPDDGCVIVRPK